MLRVGCKAIAAIALLMAASCVSVQDCLLVVNGEANCVILLDGDAGPVEKHAAEELSRYLEKVTGAKVAQTQEPQAGKRSIWLGTPETCKEIAASGVLKDVQALADQGFLLRGDGRGLLIAGREPLGVLFGVYAFLEEQVGVRWFFPGEDGEYCPKTPTLNIGRISDRQNPSFAGRCMSFGNTATNAKTTNSWDWTVRNRMCLTGVHAQHREEGEKRGAVPSWGGHVLFKLVPDSLYDAHPEFFALIDGKRVKQVNPKGRFMSQPCTSNPEVIELSAKRILQFFKESPEGTFALNNNDCGGWCQCERCVAQDPPDERKERRVSTRFTIFKNEVAKRIYAEYPNATIQTLAYQNFQLPPTGVRPDPRYTVRLCDHYRCYRHSLPDPACHVNEWFRGMFEAWAKTGSRRGIFNYYGIYAGETEERTATILCAPLEHIVADDMRYMHRLGHTEWTLGTIPPDGDYRHSNGFYNSPRNLDYWRANMQMHYVQAKLAWNINLDADALMKDLNDKFYGPAANAMGRYQALARKLWTETPGDFIYGASTASIGKSVASSRAIRELADLLDEAVKTAVGNPVVLKRLAKDQDIFKEGWLKARDKYIKRLANDARVARTSGPLTIDGNLDEADWTFCIPVAGFVKPDGQPPEVQTAVRLLHDDGNFYFGLTMEEPSTETLDMHARKRDDGTIWGGDTVELFIDPAADGRRYVHLTLTPAGALRDSECIPGAPTMGNADFNTDALLAVKTEKNRRWTVELKVSAKSLGGDIRDGSRWMMNVARARHAGKREISSWMDGSFHDIGSFRGATFLGPIIANGSFEETISLDSADLLDRHGAKTWKFGNTPPLMPKDWKLHYAGGRLATVLTEGAYAGKLALQIEGGVVLNKMDVAMQAGMTFNLAFAARGRGRIDVSLYHYGINTEDGGMKLFKVTKVGEADLNATAESNWKRYEFAYTHPADFPPIVTLALGITGRSAIDDVSAVPKK